MVDVAMARLAVLRVGGDLDLVFGLAWRWEVTGVGLTILNWGRMLSFETFLGGAPFAVACNGW